MGNEDNKPNAGPAPPVPHEWNPVFLEGVAVALWHRFCGSPAHWKDADHVQWLRVARSALDNGRNAEQATP